MQTVYFNVFLHTNFLQCTYTYKRNFDKQIVFFGNLEIRFISQGGIGPHELNNNFKNIL